MAYPPASRNALQPPASSDRTTMSALVQALLNPPPPPPTLEGLLRTYLTPLTAPQPNALASLLQPAETAGAVSLLPRSGCDGLISRASTPAGGVLNALHPPAPVAPVQVPVRRRVFFSFHYQKDIKRTVLVRNSWRFRPKDKLVRGSFFDNSLWESSKARGDRALKLLIRRGMENSSVTCVLAGEDTWSRRYVRYEIAHSLRRRNGIFTVYIDGVRTYPEGFGYPGPNPLAYMGLYMLNGRPRIAERWGDTWFEYSDDRLPLGCWPCWLREPRFAGEVVALNENAVAFDYATEDGGVMLPAWAHDVAVQAGRPG